MVTLGERIKERRELAGFSQRELAERVGLSHGAIGLYEIGRREPDLLTLQRIAYVLDTSISYLVGETDDPSPPPRVAAAHRDPSKGVKPGPLPPDTQLIIERAIRNAMLEWEQMRRSKRSGDPTD